MNYKKIIKSRSTRIKLLKFMNCIPDRTMLKIQYRIKMGKKLDLKNPKTFTEKLQWYKLNYRDPLMKICADKYSVRSYVEEQGLSSILNELYGVYDSAEDIDFDSLPNKFVMKDTLGGGSNDVYVCVDKEKEDLEKLRELASNWISKGKERVNVGREWIYCNTSHRVVIEKYIESSSPDGLVDWKFFCFNGNIEFAYWLGNRVIGESVQCGIFDGDFHPLNVYRTDEQRLTHSVSRPENYDEMVSVVKKLAEKFPHVRVDLYNENNHIIFGELTFFAGSGYMQFVPSEFDALIGEKFVLPKKKVGYND